MEKKSPKNDGGKIKPSLNNALGDGEMVWHHLGDECHKWLTRTLIERKPMNVIPAMTHPLGSGWRQPSSDKILLDDDYALMDQRTFDDLYEYSMSLPSGVYEGKMWKRYERGVVWLLGWFGPGKVPGLCSVNWRSILIV